MQFPIEKHYLSEIMVEKKDKAVRVIELAVVSPASVSGNANFMAGGVTLSLSPET